MRSSSQLLVGWTLAGKERRKHVFSSCKEFAPVTFLWFPPGSLHGVPLGGSLLGDLAQHRSRPTPSVSPQERWGQREDGSLEKEEARLFEQDAAASLVHEHNKAASEDERNTPPVKGRIGLFCSLL